MIVVNDTELCVLKWWKTQILYYLCYTTQKNNREFGRKQESVASWSQGKESLLKENVVKNVRKGELTEMIHLARADQWKNGGEVRPGGWRS